MRILGLLFHSQDKKKNRQIYCFIVPLISVFHPSKTVVSDHSMRVLVSQILGSYIPARMTITVISLVCKLYDMVLIQIHERTNKSTAYLKKSRRSTPLLISVEYKIREGRISS